MGPGLDGDQGLTADARRSRRSSTTGRPERPSLAGVFWRRRAALGTLLAAPIGWLGIVYLGSLAPAVLAASGRWTRSRALIDKSLSLENYETIFTERVYRKIVWRTVSIAALVTITDRPRVPDRVLHGPRRLDPRQGRARRRGPDAAVGLSYLVKVYSWRTIFAEDGVINWALEPFGLSGPGSATSRTWIVFSYLWLPS